jgi:hypothetical protein
MSENKSNTTATKVATTLKAEAATIQIGEQSIDCYQMPDGSYRFSMRQVSELVGYASNWLSKATNRAVASEYQKQAKPLSSKKSVPIPGQQLTVDILQNKGFKGVTVEAKIERSKNAYSTAKTISLEDTTIVITHAAFTDHKSEALGLAEALLMESLERRADAAFGVKRTEEERNQRLALRIKRVETRRNWTDVIKDHLEKQGLTGDKWMYINLTVKVNRKLFGVDNFSSNRDIMTQAQQIRIMGFEDLLCRLSEKQPNLTPDQLVTKALDNY